MALKVDSRLHDATGQSAALEIDAQKELNDEEHRQILEHREQFAKISYGIMQTWVGFLVVLTLAQFSLRPIGLFLPTTEFVTVVTTTTAAVFGFGLLVGNFLFPKGGSATRRK